MRVDARLRLLLAIKAVLDTGADAVGLDVPDSNGLVADPDGRLDAFVALFNLRLEGLNEERISWQSPETRLEKTLKILAAINIDTSRCRTVGQRHVGYPNLQAVR